MAHEFLKFKIDLKDKENYQPVLGSKDYGTFYMVYIKIKDYKAHTNDEGFIQHNYTCDFKLQNFIGEITIGFATIPYITFPNKDPKDPKDIILNIDIEPFNIDTEFKEQVLELRKEIKEKNIMETSINRKNPREDLYNPLKPEESKYLNPYRFIRDGEDYLEISSRTFGSHTPFPIPDKMAGEYDFCVPNRSVFFE
ncbi:hypothetical protein N9V96_03230 [Polaribacter sp.]|nr:hypothetical protein [Polaribacter sp.]